VKTVMSALSEWWLAVREDLQFAVKSLARVPTYTATVVLTLAVAIGGVTAVFSVLYAVLLRPLPFPNAHELLAVHAQQSKVGFLREVLGVVRATQPAHQEAMQARVVLLEGRLHEPHRLARAPGPDHKTPQCVLLSVKTGRKGRSGY